MSDLFKKGSFVVTPPIGIAAADRICLQGIAFTMQAAMLALTTIKTITRRHSLAGDYETPEKLSLYMNAWAIVDQIHMLCRLLNVTAKGKTPPQSVRQFIAQNEGATLLRNKMDHLDKGLSNLGRKKKAQAHAFGALSYYHDCGQQMNSAGQMVQFGKSVVVIFGQLTHSDHTLPFVSPQGFAVCDPTGFFQLSAFDETYPFYRLEQELPTLANFLETTVEKSVTAKFEKIAAETEIKMTELLSRPSFPGLIVADMWDAEPSMPEQGHPETPPPDRTTE